MTPATIIRESESAGVILSLSPTGTIKATGDKSKVAEWLPRIKEHKPAIIAALKENASKVSSSGWLFHFADRDPHESYFTPPITHAEALEAHSDAVAAEPIPTPQRRQATEAEARELRELLAVVCAGYPEDEKAEALALALADSEAALICYRLLAREMET